MHRVRPWGLLVMALALPVTAAAQSDIKRARAVLDRLCQAQPGVCEELFRNLPADHACKRDNSCLDIMEDAARRCENRTQDARCAQLNQMIARIAGLDPAAPSGPNLGPEPLPPPPALSAPGRFKSVPSSSSAGGKWLKPPQ